MQLKQYVLENINVPRCIYGLKRRIEEIKIIIVSDILNMIIINVIIVKQKPIILLNTNFMLFIV